MVDIGPKDLTWKNKIDDLLHWQLSYVNSIEIKTIARMKINKMLSIHCKLYLAKDGLNILQNMLEFTYSNIQSIFDGSYSSY